MTGARGSERAREEAELVARIGRGDLGAPLNELVERYKGPLFGYGCKTLGDPWLAEELVHECFIRLWRTAGRFDASRSSVSTYLSWWRGRSLSTSIVDRVPTANSGAPTSSPRCSPKARPSRTTPLS